MKTRSLILIGNTTNPENGEYIRVACPPMPHYFVACYPCEDDFTVALDRAGEYLRYPGDTVLNAVPVES
jgi:hypothetical protein